MQSYKSRNDLNSNAKSVSIGILNARLADAIDLALLTKQAHWNIKGPQFIALHEMIDGFRTELDDHVDTMAERAVQLGGTALGTTQTVAGSTTLAPYLGFQLHSNRDYDIYRKERGVPEYALLGSFALLRFRRAPIMTRHPAGNRHALQSLPTFRR